jgi:hypothetical protein
LSVQIMTGWGIVPVTRVVSTQPVVILGTASGAPFEPGRRVTPARHGSGSNLASDHGRFARPTYHRGRLLDLSV